LLRGYSSSSGRQCPVPGTVLGIGSCPRLVAISGQSDHAETGFVTNPAQCDGRPDSHTREHSGEEGQPRPQETDDHYLDRRGVGQTRVVVTSKVGGERWMLRIPKMPKYNELRNKEERNFVWSVV